MDKYIRLASKLMLADTEPERRSLLASSGSLLDDGLVLAIRDQCYAEWTSRPENVRRAAAAMRSVKKHVDSEIVLPTSLWIEAIADITLGSFKRAEKKLAQAAFSMHSLGRDIEAAQVQVAHLFALAMLGSYDEAYDEGKKAVRIFLKHSDLLAAGKAELNISNILARQGKHKAALKYCASAGKRFLQAESPSWYVMAENGLANTYADINELDKAQYHYERALTAAKSHGMEVTIAEIEACIGSVAINRGQYSTALRFLETSRQRYESLSMPHQSAIADLEIADIYFELNLLGPASEILSELGERFSMLRMRSEEARARLIYGRLLATTADNKASRRELRRARRLFARESNVSGELSALLAIVDVEADAGRAGRMMRDAASLLERSENPRQLIHVQTIEGDVLSRRGLFDRAESKFLSALNAARKLGQTDSERAILARLGGLSAKARKFDDAGRYLNRAIALTEKLHSNVGIDEFGITFLGSRAEHYQQSAAILIEQRKVSRSLAVLERGRSRSLLMNLARGRRDVKGPTRLESKTAEIRAELNQYYKMTTYSSSDELSGLIEKIRSTEKRLAENERILASLKGDVSAASVKIGEIDLAKLRNEMSGRRALVEFIEIDGYFSAYVISDGAIKLFRNITTSAAIAKLLDDLHFQFSTQRYGNIGRFAAQVRYRTDSILKALYDEIVKPLAADLRATSLVIIPAGNLHYVPFSALFDGTQYLIEQFELVLAPSASVWQKLNSAQSRPPERALLMGVPDELIPMAEQEISAIKNAFPEATAFVDADASFDNFKSNAASADVIHLACHGQFRPDNPMFSSLRLADGWITVGDLTSMQLRASLVTLSACETGMSDLYPGDELLGLVRAFLSAGASNVVVSLWNLNDNAASEMMQFFYSELTRGSTVAAALRSTQICAIKNGSSPYHWAPLVATGR